MSSFLTPHKSHKGFGCWIPRSLALYWMRGIWQWLDGWKVFRELALDWMALEGLSKEVTYEWQETASHTATREKRSLDRKYNSCCLETEMSWEHHRRKSPQFSLSLSLPSSSPSPVLVTSHCRKWSDNRDLVQRDQRMWSVRSAQAGPMGPGWRWCAWEVVVQSLSHVQLFATLWNAACQDSLSFTISQSLLKLMSIEPVKLEKGVGLFGFWEFLHCPSCRTAQAAPGWMGINMSPAHCFILDPKLQTLPGSSTTRPKHSPDLWPRTNRWSVPSWVGVFLRHVHLPAGRWLMTKWHVLGQSPAGLRAWLDCP